MRFFKKDIQAHLSRALDVILPPRCVISGEIVERQGMLSPQGWTGLEFIASPFCKSCGVPFDYTLEEGAHCTQCLDFPPAYNSARAALRYNDASRDLILGFKHGDKTYAVKAFLPWLERAGKDMLESADYLVPVPLHPMRLLKRRYNQAALMAYALSNKTGVPCDPLGLRRVRSTPPQGHMNTGDRHKNVRKAFAVGERFSKKIEDKNIVLIDDVYTTGATVRECTKVLKAAGAVRVDILTLARIVREEYL